MQALWKTDTLTIGSAEGDRVALGILYKSADAELRVLLTGWNTFADLEEWAGGTINQEGRVIKIVLQRTFRGLVEPSRWKELGSSILAEVCQLGALEELKLEYLGLMDVGPIAGGGVSPGEACSFRGFQRDLAGLQTGKDEDVGRAVGGEHGSRAAASTA